MGGDNPNGILFMPIFTQTLKRGVNLVTIEETLEIATKNNRVCPHRWSELYDMLPNKKRQGGGWEPALPLILGGWRASSNLDKRMRLQQHIEWAAQHGVLNEGHKFLLNLNEEDWHHFYD